MTMSVPMSTCSKPNQPDREYCHPARRNPHALPRAQLLWIVEVFVGKDHEEGHKQSDIEPRVDHFSAMM